jgi:hypothetical protein
MIREVDRRAWDDYAEVKMLCRGEGAAPNGIGAERTFRQIGLYAAAYALRLDIF